MLQVSYLQGLVSQLQKDVYKSTKLCVKKFITGFSLIQKKKRIPTTEPSRCFCAQIKILLFVKKQNFHTVESTSSSTCFRTLFTYVCFVLTVILCMGM
jgi:hypothetical protein